MDKFTDIPMPDRPTHDLTCSVCGAEWRLNLPGGSHYSAELAAKRRCFHCGGQPVPTGGWNKMTTTDQTPDYQRGRLDGLREAAKEMCGYCRGTAYPRRPELRAIRGPDKTGHYFHAERDEATGGSKCYCHADKLWWLIRHIEAGEPDAIE